MTELIFGVGVPASAAPGDDPVGIASAAERLGYDFISVADHPCGSDPSYEATAILTWIAARTSRIKVASRVLGVPFRRPAMVAKLAASLDLLSAGRFVLGLGAGYSDEEIAAVGGPALSPAEKVDGLAEAIEVVRGAWTRSGYTQHGRHHSVRDLEMEPKPVRRIPIWLGTFGPRALAVTGRLADGWIPSLGYRPAGEFPAMRRRIDAAAKEAGRPPAEIRGILNATIHIDPDSRPRPDMVTGSAGQAISQLRQFLDLGFTGFNFNVSGPDRIADMRRIAEDVLPALRSMALQRSWTVTPPNWILSTKSRAPRGDHDGGTYRGITPACPVAPDAPDRIVCLRARESGPEDTRSFPHPSPRPGGIANSPILGGKPSAII